MKTAVSLTLTLALALSFLGGSVFAQNYSDNPYMPSNPYAAPSNPFMPSGSMGDDQRQQIIQNAINALNGASGYGDMQEQPQEQEQQQQMEPAPVAVNPLLERLQVEQAQEIKDIASERADREFQVRALQNVLEVEIHELQKKVEEQQREIDSLQHSASHY